ncbi:MAG: ribonucleoside triphosphate reductase [Candidatus Paceibacteria bacterium]
MAIHKVQKRNGSIVDFDINKIENAISKAISSTGRDDAITSEVLASDVLLRLEELYSDEIPAVEEVQEVVENILIEYGYSEVAKSYIRYRQKREERRKNKNVVVEVENTIEEYLDKLDWRVDANANQGYSLGGMMLNTSGKVTANYWLSHVYPKKIGDAHRNGDMHIHDLDMFAGYCAGWSLRQLLEEGFNGVDKKIESGPPKHLNSAVAQMVNFFGTLQNEWAGAQAFSSFDTYLSPFVKKYEQELRKELNEYGIRFSSKQKKEKYIKDKQYEYVYQCIQSFVFNVNIPSRWGTQTPFTNITMDWKVPEGLKGERLRLGGEEFEYTFGELQDEVDLINECFIKVMMSGDKNGRTFTFPIPTYNINENFDWQDENTDLLFEMTAKYGTPYFQNFINSDMEPGDIRSMCCRLQLDKTELKKRGNGLFGSAEMTGSIGVVTLNAARIGYQYSGDNEGFFQRVEELMAMAKTSLEIKRKEIKKWMDRGLFPYTKRYLGSLENHFSTIGINGVNEAIRNFTDDEENITTKWGQEFAKEILDFMRDKLKDYQEETGNLYNLEATPAEGTTYRFAKEDQKQFDDIIQAGTEDAPYYTNSTQIPTGYTDDLFEALELQDDLQTKYTGGTVLHGYMSEKVSSPEMCKKMVKRTLENFHLPYFTITPTFSICPKHGYLSGEHDFCPKCDEEIGYEEDNTIDEEWREDYVSEEAHV